MDLIKEQAKAYRVNKTKVETVDEREQQLNSQARENEEARKQNDETSKQVQVLFDKATMGNLSPKTYENLKNEISGLHDEMHHFMLRQSELEAQLRKSVPLEKHEEIVLVHKKQGSLIQQLERNYRAEKEKCEALNSTVAKLKADNSAKEKTIASLKQTLRDVYESFMCAIRAVRMFKFGKSKYKIENISDEQERLIDSVADYAAKWAKEDGFRDIAADMLKATPSISEGIQEQIDERTPKISTRPKL